MHNEYFVIYDVTAGAVMLKGNGRAGIAAHQTPAPGFDVLAVPQDAWSGDLADHIDAVRDALWEKIKAKREATIAGGAVTPEGVVDSDEASRANLTGAALAALIAKSGGEPFNVEWTMLDNSAESFDADQMMAVAGAVLSHVDAAHARARALRVEVDAATTVQDLLRIDCSAGWSAI